MSKGKTTVQMRAETRQLLQKVGRKEQTYDDLINELVAKSKELEEYKQKKEGLDAN